MIPKFAKHRKDGKSSIKSLIEYMADIEKALINTNDDMAARMNINMPQMGIEDTIGWMRDTASKLPKAKKPVEHVILAWKPDERPTDEEMFEAGKRWLKKMGWKHNEAVICIHKDKTEEHGYHIHIAVNKILYNELDETAKSVNPGWKHNEAHRCAREVELEMGFEFSNGNYIIAYDEYGKPQVIKNPDVGNKQSGSSNATYEVYNGAESFKSYLNNDIKNKILPALDNMSSWSELHAELAKFNLKLIKAGGGLKICNHDTDPEKQIYGKASDVSRKFSIKALEKKLGDFTESTIDYDKNEPEEKYNPEQMATRYSADTKENIKLLKKKQRIYPESLKPKEMETLKSQQENEDLYESFKEHKERYENIILKKYSKRKAEISKGAKEFRKFEREKAKRTLREKLAIAKANGKSQEELDHLQHVITYKNTINKGTVDQKIKEAYIEAKKLLRHEKKQAFIDYCYDIAKNENHKHYNAAKRVLRRDYLKQQNSIQNRIAHEDFTFKPVIIAEFVIPLGVFVGLEHNFIAGKGMEFRRNQELVFTDYGRTIQFTNKASDEDLESGLLLAAQKFGAVTLTGNDEYKKRMCKLAAKHWITVKNPELKELVELYKKQNKEGRKTYMGGEINPVPEDDIPEVDPSILGRRCKNKYIRDEDYTT